MLAYLLALVVGLGSFALYMAAFFFPEVHRKSDFIWSGVGLFYALVLWVCAGRISGGVLLGQTASVALLGWFGWQTLTLRQQITPPDQQTTVPTAAELKTALTQSVSTGPLAPVAGLVDQQFSRLTTWIKALLTTTTQSTRPPVPNPPVDPYVPLTPADFADAHRREDEIKRAVDATVTDITPTEPSRPPRSTAIPPSAPSKSTPTKPPRSTEDATSTSIVQQLQGVFKGFTKRESKPVYVRKQFRTPTEADADISEPDPVKVEDTVEAVSVEAIAVDVVDLVDGSADGSDANPGTIEVTIVELETTAAPPEAADTLLDEHSAKEPTAADGTADHTQQS